ncbi:MAG: ABC transporter ATP-binding protein [Bacteroidota bacterium]|nr:ABC transporter ATP-binding protein [Bacteroidota bacterium]MDP4231081.1 ABC transporter ATP-binding protein [Bacteroidota bacterium]MDP4236307.1 ABC transporter ATP-binding protein [Bacteroidota bacterium]
MALLEVKNLQTYFFTDDGVSKAVDDVSYSVDPKETLGVVGESGCGKSVTALSIMRLIPDPPGKTVGGEILFEGRDLLKISEEEMRSIRGNKIGMIFQEPMTSLNPVFTVGNQIEESILLHEKVSKEEAKSRAIEMLKKVGIPAPEQRYREYPHQLSGGMRQRIMIAMALACNPSILIADEPTTALDVTVQAQILELIKSLQESLGMGVILITHDLGVIAETADKVAVMYASHIVEYSNADEIYYNPLHPYTVGLLGSIPKLNIESDRLMTIEGTVPVPTNYPPGCNYAARCPYATPLCISDEPRLIEHETGHWAACHHWDEVKVKRPAHLVEA